MNKKYLKENNLYEAHKQFMRLCEWSYIPSSLEEDDNEQEDPNNGQGMPPTGDTPQEGGEMPPMTGGQDNAPQDGNIPPVGDNMPQGEEEPPMSPQNDAPPTNEPPTDEPPVNEPKDDENVIDVDDITNAQEKVNDKVNSVGKNLGKVDDKITNLINSLDKMQQMIDNNNQEIETLKQEFSKRNPTSVEKLNLRSLDSYPFNVRPDEYWRDKSATSNYQGYSDNEEPTTSEYKITNNDVDDFDEKEVANSFYVDPDLEQDINKIFNLK